jgi:hypothetical protein
MTSAEVHRHVCAAFDEFERQRFEGVGPNNWEPLRAALVAWCRGINPATAFAGLLKLLESDRWYAYQDIAGALLDKADVPCPLSVAEFLRRVLPLWDLSAGTVPRYAARVFGREAVLAHVRELQAAGASWPGRGALDGVRYQLGEHPNEQRQA